MSAQFETRMHRLERALRGLTTSTKDEVEALKRRVASLEKKLESVTKDDPPEKLPPDYRP